MFRRFAPSLVLFFLAMPLAAGVVFEVEVTDHTRDSPETWSQEAVVEGKNIKMEIHDARSGNGDAIFRGDRREMLIVDHQDKTYMVVDQDMVGGVSAQLESVSAQLQEALKSVPENQRARIEELMRTNMPSQGAVASGPKSTVKKTDERAEHSGYPCVRYDVLQDGRKVKEYWVTDWDNVDGGENLEDVYLEMADFYGGLLEALENSLGGAGNPLSSGFEIGSMFESLSELGGFPVVTREFGDDGSLENESVLRSAQRRALDPDAFEPPSGYKRRQMMPTN